MDVTSLHFIGFAAFAAGIYHLSRSVMWRRTVLLIANLIFLATLSMHWKSYLPLLAFLALGYFGVWMMQRLRSHLAYVLLLGIAIFLFVCLKQYRFLPESLFLRFSYVTVGLSYIFFRVLQMIIDARGGTLTNRIGVISYLNYTLNFTTLIAGPIQLYEDYAASQAGSQLTRLTVGRAAAAIERVAIGFFKVRVLSMFALALHGAAIGDLSGSQRVAPRVLTAALIATIYPFYLYFNFSGYCDIMIGLARFLELDLPENFDRSFASTSFLEFWGRWHMTLSNWLKAYVYTPLVKVLMQKFPSAAVEPFLGVFAFFVTFFLIGAWHGQTSEFLFYGVLLGLGISLNKLYQVLMVKSLGRKRFKALTADASYEAFARGLTFTYFAFSLLCFWSTWPQMRRLAGVLSLSQNLAVWCVIWLGATATLALWESLRTWALNLRWQGAPLVLAVPVRAAWATYLSILGLLIIYDVHVPAPVLYRIF
jgi:D-alanyl-lipoteichoic acid acyltransferase DltB (MBOAT superfamily)